jgi:lipopolysaccharide export system protein LptC
MITPRWVQIVLIIVIAISGYYLLTGSESITKQITPNAELPEFSGHLVSDTNYATNGARNYRISASYLDHYAKSGDTVFENIVLLVYRDGDVVEWKVVSDRAVLDKKQHLRLQGNVQADNLLPESAFDHLLTESLVIELDSKEFYSDTEVTLKGTTFYNVGQSLTGSFETNQATLINQVKGVYEITP